MYGGIIAIKALPGRIVYDAAENGNIVPNDRYVTVAYTQWVWRLINVWGDVTAIGVEPPDPAPDATAMSFNNAEVKNPPAPTDFLLIQESDGGLKKTPVSALGGGGGVAQFVHTQTVSSNVWNINHALGRYPSVSLVDGVGSEFIADVKYTDVNNVLISLSKPSSGRAFLN